MRPPFPSKIDFASLLQYSPRGVTAISRQSRDITYAIKQDGVYARRNVIDFAAEVVEQELAHHPFLADHFGKDVTLIPIPRSSPQRAGALWPPQRICQALIARDLVQEVLPCLVRQKPVRKAATTAGDRPEPTDHFDSILLASQASLAMPSRITLIDDVITRGSSFIGVYPHIESAFPGVPIRCFALVRTESQGEVATIRDPVYGQITYQDSQCVRRP